MAGPKSIEHKTEAVALTETRSINGYKHGVDNIEDVVIARLTDKELFKISADAFSWKSMAALRLAGVMFVQGCNHAGYGTDWGTISEIVSILLSGGPRVEYLECDMTDP